MDNGRYFGLAVCCREFVFVVDFYFQLHSVTEKLSRKIHIFRCDFAIKQRFLLNFFLVYSSRLTRF